MTEARTSDAPTLSGLVPELGIGSGQHVAEREAEEAWTTKSAGPRVGRVVMSDQEGRPSFGRTDRPGPAAGQLPSEKAEATSEATIGAR